MESLRYKTGMELFSQIHPDAANNIESFLRDLLPELGQYSIEFGYGDIMSRPELDLRTRELITIAMLSAMGTAPVQLEMHIGGALKSGASKQEITEIILQLAAFAGFPAAFNAILIAKKAFEEHDHQA